MDLFLFHEDIIKYIAHLFIFKFVMNVFKVMLRGDYINNASSILRFNIRYAFVFIKMMYYECWNKQFELIDLS